MTSTDYLYFDYYQGEPETEPVAIGGHLTLCDVYDYEPIPDTLTQTQARHILGAQANVWTQYTTRRIRLNTWPTPARLH